MLSGDVLGDVVIYLCGTPSKKISWKSLLATNLPAILHFYTKLIRFRTLPPRPLMEIFRYSEQIFFFEKYICAELKEKNLNTNYTYTNAYVHGTYICNGYCHTRFLFTFSSLMFESGYSPVVRECSLSKNVFTHPMIWLQAWTLITKFD